MKPLITVAIAFLLVACSAPIHAPIHKTEPSNSYKSQPANTVTHWQLQGRLSVQADQESWLLKLHWSQNHDYYEWHLLAPFNQGSYVLQHNERGTCLQDQEHIVQCAEDAEQLLQQSFNWKIPLGGLKYWVRGLSNPDVPIEHQLFDEQGRLKDIQQSGWRISILRYTTIDNIYLPEKIFMHHDRFKLKLVIQQWNLNI